MPDARPDLVCWTSRPWGCHPKVLKSVFDALADALQGKTILLVEPGSGVLSRGDSRTGGSAGQARVTRCTAIGHRWAGRV